MRCVVNVDRAVDGLSQRVFCRPPAHAQQPGRMRAMPISDVACLGSAIKSVATALPPAVPGIVSTLLQDAGNLLDLQPAFGGIIRLSVWPDPQDEISQGCN